MKNFSNFTASLHTHVRSLYDAYINAEQLCEKIVKMGGKGCAITDHGVLSSIEDYKTVFRDNGLKLIPGCELYVDGGILGRLHLVVLATNGYELILFDESLDEMREMTYRVKESVLTIERAKII